MFGFVADVLGMGAKEEYANERQEDMQQFNSDEAARARDWQKQMRATQYQTSVEDMQRAGLNPMLAYHQGGAGVPTGASASSGVAGGGGTTNFAASMQSASQVELNEAAAEKMRAEAENLRAQTPVHAVTMDKLRQEISESVERIDKIRQEVKTGAASAAQLEQQTINLKEAIPQIRATVEQLKALANLNAAQAYEALTRGQLHGETIHLTRQQVEEIQQRVKANLPKALADLQQVEAHLKQLDLPKAGMNAAVHSTRVGAALAGIRNFIGSLLGR